MFLNSSQLKSVIASMQSLDQDKLVNIISLAGSAIGQDLDRSERTCLGNSLMVLGYVLSSYPLSDITQENIENNILLQATEINMELLEIQRRLDEVQKKMESNKS